LNELISEVSYSKWHIRKQSIYDEFVDRPTALCCRYSQQLHQNRNTSHRAG